MIYRFRVIATCSPSNFDLVRSLGASHVLDYRDIDVIPRIHELSPRLEYAFDTMGSSKTSSTVSEALTGVSRRLCTIRQSDAYQSNISSCASITDVCVWKAFLHDHWEGERRFSESFYLPLHPLPGPVAFVNLKSLAISKQPQLGN